MTDLYLGGRLELVHDDLTQLPVDAIVNAANSRLLGGGVDGAIHEAAGPKLLEACRALGGCPVGEAKITEGFQLPARWVIHAVGPQWRGGAAGEPELLESAYRASLARAAEVGATKVAFPAISTGIYAYPLEAATLIALLTMASVLEAEPSFERLTACAFSTRVFAAYQHAAENLFGAS